MGVQARKRSARLSNRARQEYLVNLGRAIRTARGTLTQAQLGALLDVPQTTISRCEKGLVALDVLQVLEIETALGLEAGSLLVACGLVENRISVKDVAQAILVDPHVDPTVRRDLANIYENYVKLSKRPRR